MTDRPADGARLVLLTPRGPGGVAVVAIEGPGRAALAHRLLRSANGDPLAPRTHAASGGPRLALLWPAEEPLDEVLLVEREGALELHLHGSEAVLVALEAAAGRLHEPEPSPAAALVRGALGPAQLALGLEQLGHDFGAFVEWLERAPESERRPALEAAVERSRRALALAQPTRLVLCGAQNAGKSTLMNRLLFRERVLAGSHPGLTRDPVSEATTLDGYPYLLVDTAGEGRVATEIDQRALELGRSQRLGALRLVVVDGSRGPGELEFGLAGAATLWIQNKIDLPQAPWPTELRPRVAVSCLEAAVAPEVRRLIGAQLTALRGLSAAGPVGGGAALCPEQFAQLQRLV